MEENNNLTYQEECAGVEPQLPKMIEMKSSSNITLGGTDEQRTKLFEAMSKYYAEVQNPENTTTNTFFKAKYAPLNEVLNTVRPVMGKYGLSCTQTTSVENGECFVTTLLTHSGGGYIYFPVLKGKPAKADIQGVGATLTYLRRFSLNAVCGVSGEVDDDGNSATRGGNKPVGKEAGDLIQKITEKVNALKEQGVAREAIGEAVKAGGSPANFNKITDPAVAQAVIGELNKLGGNA